MPVCKRVMGFALKPRRYGIGGAILYIAKGKGITMDAVIVMCLGVLVGRFLVPGKIKKGNELISLSCTFLLILSMGIKLGRDEALLQNLSTLGLSSLLLFLVPTLLSIAVVFILTRKFMAKKTSNQEKR